MRGFDLRVRSPCRGAEGPFPAVVLVTGSGAQNRDEELMGHKPFLVLADHLTRRGIAVLRYDDRGVGGSGGDPRTATAADTAADAVAALDFLRARPEVDARKVGIAGHSEGALAAFIAAAGNPAKVNFIVSMAGPGVPGRELIRTQSRDIMILNGAPSDLVDGVLKMQTELLDKIWGSTPEFVEANLDSIATTMVQGFTEMPGEEKEIVRRRIGQAGSPPMRFLAGYDPAADLRRVRCPVLAVNGAKDMQVRAAENLAAIAASLREGGNETVRTIEYPDLNHLFQTAATGSPAEYGTIEETFNEGAMDDIAAWILNLP